MKTRNIKQKETGSKRLLIVEDRLDYMANAYEVALGRGYEVDTAFDLESALRHLDTNRPRGVITDMCFEEKGVSSVCYDDKLADICLNGRIRGRTSHDAKDLERYDSLPLELKRLYKKTLDKSTQDKANRGESRGKTSLSLRAEIMKKSLICMPFELYKRVEQNLLGRQLDSSSERFTEKITEGNSYRNPALGYFIAKKAKELGIPVSIVSSLNHASHALPAIYATGLISQKELIAQAEKDGDSYRGTVPDMVIKNATWKIFYDKRRLGFAEVRKDPKTALLMDRQYIGFILDKVILPGSCLGKNKLYYEFAIDQIEGNIDKTRPYLVT